VRKGEATRSRVVDAAARLAAVRGLTAVSLADVAEVVRLSKSGLFKHFEDKEAMQLAVVESTTAAFDAFVLDAAMEAPAGRPRVERMFARWLDWGDSEWGASGCPMHAFSVELDDQPGPLRDLLRARLQAFRDRAIPMVQALRDPPLSFAEAQATYFQMKSFLMGHADARRMMDDADARRATEAAFQALLDRTARAAA
jgi:AcrR family transcriptional regulator